MKAFGACRISWTHFFISYRHPVDRFWFFAARNNPDTAPLITWFNGGVSTINSFKDLQYLPATNFISPEVPA
jgi:Serine carboxypeptidase